MTLQEVMEKLESLGSEKGREAYARQGAGENQFGVGLSPIRDLAKQIKRDHPLALEFWATGNADAMLLATLIMDRRLLSPEDMSAMVAPLTYPKLVDWFVENVVKPSKHVAALQEQWVDADSPYVRRGGWSLLNIRVLKDDPALDHPAIVSRIQAEMKEAPVTVQEPMNRCLCEIAARVPSLTQRCIEIGERLEVFKDYPVPKGCTSPYAPIWIELLLSRKQTAG